MKKIMILYSVYTGHGHKSISNALLDHFKLYPDVEVEMVDGFSLIGRAGVQASKVYGPVTRFSKDLWKLAWTISNQSPKAMEVMMATLIHDGFMRKLKAFMPDLIVCVHSMFVSAVINTLEEYGMDIPFVTLEADLINIHSSWCDPRATLTLCPTREALDSSVIQGMPRSKLRVCGFPVREQFCEKARNEQKKDYTSGRPIKCLITSGGEGSGNILRIARQLLEHVNSEVSIVCGRNERLRKSLEESLAEDYSDRVKIYGFVTDMENVMVENDLIIARGSPNTLMEAVTLTVPLVITGSLPGQEADNPSLMVSHGLGVACYSTAALPVIVKNLMRDGGRRLKEMRKAQAEYRNLDAAGEIVRLLYDMAEPKERMVPFFRPYLPVTPRTRYTVRKIKRSFRRLKSRKR